MIKHLDEMVEVAASRGTRRVVVAYGQDTHSIGAAIKAVDRGVAEVILVGNPTEIEKSCATLGVNSAAFKVCEQNDPVRSIETAVKMINDGGADILMKGLLPTDTYMHAILNKEWGLLPPKRVLSHVTVLEIPAYPKLLVVGDVAVIPEPDFDQKKQIVSYLIRVARSLGVDRPLVACLAPSEQLLPKVTSSVEAAMLSVMGTRGQFGANVVIDGPLALDLAVDPESARTKKVNSEVAGNADCILFPNIESGNTFYKACTTFGASKLAAMVIGTTAPCVLTSRGDSTDSKLYAIALASLAVK